MRKFGVFLLIFAAGNFIVFIMASINGETDAAGNKLSGTLLLGVIGICLYYLGKKNENSNQEDANHRQNIKEVSQQSETYWQRYKRFNPTKASAIESITGRNMAMQSNKDAQELVSSLERWAKNIGCDIQNIKTEYLKSFKSVFGKEDTKDIIEHLKNFKYTEEANLFHISQSNTCTHFMIKWLTESMQKETASSPNNHIKYRNKTSARDLIIAENSELQFVENPKTGKIFFVCGSKKGYVSPAAVEKMKTGSLDDFYYAEVSIDNGDYVPCLMVLNKPNVVHSLKVGADRSVSNGANKDYTGEEMLKKELEIRNRLCFLMKNFIQTEYCELKEFQELEDLAIPIANAKSFYVDNESMIDICKKYGLDYANILNNAASLIVEEYISLKSKSDDDLPF
jgi:hypothetical protein